MTTNSDASQAVELPPLSRVLRDHINYNTSDVIEDAILDYARAAIAQDRAARAHGAGEAVAWTLDGTQFVSAKAQAAMAKDSVWKTRPIRPLYYAAPTIPQAAAVPEGWVCVPREPTMDMLPEAWRIANGKVGLGVDHECLRAIYRSMLAAAPTPAEGEAFIDGDCIASEVAQPPSEADRTREGGDVVALDVRVERLKAAIEGELDGLAIEDYVAVAILDYLDTGLPPGTTTSEGASHG